MVWLKWNGAVAVLLGGAGLVWAQPPTPTTIGVSQRIMVLHENGKSLRCRLLQTWQLPDGRAAQQLQAVESGEIITIVDDARGAGLPDHPRAQSKRIFHWGLNRRTPPPGSPQPPDYLAQPGAPVMKPANTTPPAPIPVAASGMTGPVIRTSAEAAAQTAPALPPAAPQAPTPTTPPAGAPAAKAPTPIAPIPAGQATPTLVNNACEPCEPCDVCEEPTNKLSLRSLLPSRLFGKKTPVIVNECCEECTPTAGPVIVNGSGKGPVVVGSTCDPCTTVAGSGEQVITIPEPTARGWRVGEKLQGWLHTKSTPSASVPVASAAPSLPPATVVQTSGPPVAVIREPQTFSTAMPMAPETNQALSAPKTLSIPSAPPGPSTATASGPGSVLPPGLSLINPGAKKAELVKLPAPPEKEHDVLTTPEKFNPGDKAVMLTDVTPPPTPAPTPTSAPAPAPAPAPATASASRGPKEWPLGSQSVLASRSGLQSQVTYVPVPTKTVPEPARPPVPPAPQLPQAPQLNAFVNAFSPPPPPVQPMGDPGIMGHPAMAQGGMHPQQQQQQQMMLQARMMNPGMMPPGMVPPGMPNPAMMPPGMVPPGMPNPAMMPPGMPGRAMMPNSPTNPMNAPRHYTGPQPPNPFGNPTAQTGVNPYQVMQTAYQQQMIQQSTAQVASTTVSGQIDQLVRVLRESPYPAQREWAAQTLSALDSKSHPQVVPVLVEVARQDPAATVRAGCVYGLSRMNASGEAVAGLLQALHNDADPRVRQEVEQAQTRLGLRPTSANSHP